MRYLPLSQTIGYFPKTRLPIFNLEHACTIEEYNRRDFEKQSYDLLITASVSAALAFGEVPVQLFPSFSSIQNTCNSPALLQIPFEMHKNPGFS